MMITCILIAIQFVVLWFISVQPYLYKEKKCKHDWFWIGRKRHGVNWVNSYRCSKCKNTEQDF